MNKMILTSLVMLLAQSVQALTVSGSVDPRFEIVYAGAAYQATNSIPGCVDFDEGSFRPKSEEVELDFKVQNDKYKLNIDDKLGGFSLCGYKLAGVFIQIAIPGGDSNKVGMTGLFIDEEAPNLKSFQHVCNINTFTSSGNIRPVCAGEGTNDSAPTTSRKVKNFKLDIVFGKNVTQ
jgi:hypothetical protein